jgi:hypothetical protein
MKLVLREKQVTDEGAGEPEKVLDNFGYPVTQPRTMEETSLEDAGSAKRGPHIAMIENCDCPCCKNDKRIKLVVVEKKNKKPKHDRCYQKAKRTYDAFPSYNAASAIARCRRGEIWKKGDK